MKKHVVLTMILLPILLFILSSDTYASEGEIYLSNQEGTSASCKAFSVLMPSLDYEILMTCRQLVYPGDIDQFNYVAWAEPSEGGAERLGEVGVGKVNFETDQPFSRLFITRERGSRPRNPSNAVVMSGNVAEIDEFKNQDPEPSQQIPPQSTPTPSPTAAPTRSFISRLFEPAKIIAFLGVVILIVLVFILTRR